jgi:myo-inositol 2-dehydrogenase/D-chiro-inositol 1-dehydrogenase
MMNTNRPIRVAVVGAGGWGYEHARVLTNRPGVELAGIFGRQAGKTAKRAADFHTRPYTDLGRMLMHEKPDLVTVSLPNQQHFETTRRLIAAGVPLLVEKPLVFDLAEAETLLAEAAAKDLFFAINFNHRYAKPVVMAHEAIRQGRLGEIVFAHWRFGGEGGLDHPFNNLIETQCHGFDTLEHLCGPIESVSAQMTDKTCAGVFRTIAMALQFRGGAVATLLGSYDSSYAYPGTHVLEVNGTKGRVLIEDTVRRYTFNEAKSETAEVWQAGYFNDRDRDFYRTFDRHMDAVIDAVRRGGKPPIHARAGRRALAVALAAIESHRTGRRVAVDVGDYQAMQTPEVVAPPPGP